MREIPQRLTESRHDHSGLGEYKINEDARKLREKIEENQGLPRGQVAAYTTHLVVGIRKGGNIYDEKTGRLIGVDPYPEDD